jgi:dTDP-4-dehydrorhamnose reductase
MATILITGANGQVGNELQFLAAQYSHFQFFFTDYEVLDITNQEAVLSFFETHFIDYCINCAAYTAVDRAEEEVEKANAINVKGVENLALACQKNDAVLLHLSTDYVYHNAQNRPFVETDATAPQSVYARTKLQGEQIAQAIHPLTMVVRTSWVYSTFGHNFVKTMLRLGKERPELCVVFDQIGTPTYARPLAKTMLDIITQAETGVVPKTQLQGIFHYSNEGVTSWYDFALAIVELAQISTSVIPIETKDYPTAASRPPFSVLNKAKIKQTFQLDIPHWRESLKDCLSDMQVQI